MVGEPGGTMQVGDPLAQDGGETGGVSVEIEDRDGRGFPPLDAWGLLDEMGSETSGHTAGQLVEGGEQGAGEEGDVDEVLGALPPEAADLFESEALLDEAVVLLDRPAGEVRLEDVDHLLRSVGRLGREQGHGLGVLAGTGDDEPEGPAVLSETPELDPEGAEGAAVRMTFAGRDPLDIDLGNAVNLLDEVANEQLAITEPHEP